MRRQRKVLSIVLLITFLLVAVFGATYYYRQQSDNTVNVAVFHGPNPNSQENINSIANNTAVISEPVGLQKTTPSPKITATDVISTPTTPSMNPNDKDFGIAGGGGLVYLNQQDLNKYFENLVDLGVRWIRWDIDWNYVQGIDVSSFNWTGIDMVADTAQKYGIKSLGIITYTPKWARDGSCVDRFVCQPKNSSEFGYFAGLVAKRYRGRIDYWEIWNEPNINNFFAPRPNTEKYFEMLKIAYTEIKKNSPQATVLSGGLSPSDNKSDGSTSPYTYIQKLYKLGFSKYCDAVALHPYTYPETPEHTIYWNSWKDMIRIRELMVKNNDSRKKIWVTEYGAPTGGPGKEFFTIDGKNYKYDSSYVSEKMQTQMLIEATTFYNKASSDWMGPFFWYSLRDEDYNYNTPENYFGLIKRDWTKKTIFGVFKDIILHTN